MPQTNEEILEKAKIAKLQNLEYQQLLIAFDRQLVFSFECKMFKASENSISYMRGLLLENQILECVVFDLFNVPTKVNVQEFFKIANSTFTQAKNSYYEKYLSVKEKTKLEDFINEAGFDSNLS
jgi:hypothetical protein